MSSSDRPSKYVPGVGWRRGYNPEINHHHPTHDYREVGTYHITLCVEGRYPLLGRITGTTLAKGDPPRMELSWFGRQVLNSELPKIHDIYPMVEVWAACLMPDHMHLIVRINAPLPEGKHLGIVIGAFKGGVSRLWWSQADPSFGLLPADADLARRHAAHSPLFESDYNDQILMHDGQLDHWKAYLRDNPFRKRFREEHPDFMRRALCLEIGGVRYGAFGNFQLLRYPSKLQVFFHRTTDGLPTEDSPLWPVEHSRIADAADQGTVLVTPGISECEKRVKNEALSEGWGLIHLQKEPISRHWKPERSRYEACQTGSLLILAPWAEDLAVESDYGRFHRLNDLAATIAALSPDTVCRILQR